jgi:hypothetical protein
MLNAWRLDSALQQFLIPRVFTRVMYIHVHSLHVSRYYTSPATLHQLLPLGHTACSTFPPKYLINLSIMTFDRRYYSGALSKAVTKQFGLLRFDVALLLKRCETFRRNRNAFKRCLRCQNSTDRNSRFTPLTNPQDSPTAK